MKASATDPPPRTGYLLAVDGGASSTRAIVGTAAGEILGIGVGGPTGLFADDAGRERLRRALDDAVAGALRTAAVKPERVMGACLGLTGVFDEHDDGRTARELAGRLLPTAKIEVTSDAAPALLGASCGAPGILTYGGTGSIAYGIDDDGNHVRSGGWGYLVDDRGGGFRIGAEALEAVFRASDGRGPDTTLTGAVLEHFAVSDAADLLRMVYLHDVADRAQIASLVPVVRSAAEDGDTVAQQLLDEAAHRLVELTAAVDARLPSPYGHRVFPVGGVFRTGRSLWEPFRAALAARLPHARVHDPAFPPVIGAYLMAIMRFEQEAIGAEVLGEIRRSRALWGGVEPT